MAKRPNISNIRDLIWEQSNQCCDLCRVFLGDSAWEAGHKVDHCVGGSSDINNLKEMLPLLEKFRG